MQFSAEDVGIADAVKHAVPIDLGGVSLPLATPADLLVLKLAAAEEPRLRPSRRRRDLLDILTLAEEHPDAAAGIIDLKARVARLGAALLNIGS